MTGLSELAGRLRSRLTIVATGLIGASALVAWSAIHASLTTPLWVALGATIGITLLALAQALGLSTRLARQTPSQLAAPTELAWRDDLTDCLTRRRFLELLNERLKDIRTKQMKGHPVEDLTLLILDVDHFKLLNDGFGHSAGDKVLTALGRIALQEPDWVTGRMGGDEFAVMIPGSDHRAIAESARRFSERLHLALRNDEATRAFHGVSIGIASAPKDSDEPTDLLNKADMALYVGKRNGRGQSTFYHPEMLRSQAEERQISRDLHAAMILNQLELYYQPIVDGGGQQVAVEALLRWRDGLGNFIPPDKFIEVAEKSQLIDRLGEWVFRRACRDYEILNVDRISVNISGAQLRHDGLLPMLRRVMMETKRHASNFILELTETVVINANPTILRAIAELRDMGFLIALDDFGTGNGSFTLLRDLPLDIVKIDKSYIQKLETDVIAQIFVTAVGEIGKSLGMAIVAEGVETSTQEECARIAGTHRFQGYLYGKAQPLRQLRPAHQTSGPFRGLQA